MTICYLDPEDEITGAVARIRAVEDGEVVVVLPPGSRIATSRINFRLLAREAEAKGLTVVAVSDEPGVRALAISAGLPAYDSVAAAEGGLAEFARQERRLAERLGTSKTDTSAAPPAAAVADEPPDGESPDDGMAAPASNIAPTAPATARPTAAAAITPPTRPRTAETPEQTRVMAVPVAERDEQDDPAGEADDDSYARRGRRRRRRWTMTPLIALMLLLALVGVAAYGAYTFVPTATVTIRPSLTDVGPVSGVVVADPRVAVVDPGGGVIPAQQILLPLSAGGEFEATGSRVTTVRATGTVRFTSTNTINDIAIPAGTRVSTPGGVGFDTTAPVVVPRAVFDTGTPGRIDAPVRAVRAGVRGNVAAGQITTLPEGLAQQLVTVDNPQATSGGERRETRVVAAGDYEAALAELRDEIDERLDEAVADPANTPRGLTLYPRSGRVTETTAQPAADAIVGSAAETFTLTLAATATVLAVNETQVTEVVLEQLRALVPPTSTLLESSIQASHTPGELSSGTIVYSASANGRAYRLPDRDALVEEIRGLPVSEARAIIGRYGSAELSVWPDFVDRLPDQPARINVTIIPPAESL